MQAEFQAGWLQSADEGAPRPADPSNTTLALHELLRDGAHGIVVFPPQDTIDPDGWEAPWANWSYAWDAALTAGLAASPRYAPTAAFGDLVRAYGAAIADTHPQAGVAIVWPPSLFSSSVLTANDFSAFADATIAMQQECARRRLSCRLVDLAYDDRAAIDRYAAAVIPIVVSPRLAATIGPPVAARLAALRREGRLKFTLAGLRPSTPAAAFDDATFLASNQDAARGFLDVVDPSDGARTFGRTRVAARSAVLLPVGITARTGIPAVPPPTGTPPPFAARDVLHFDGSRLYVAFAPNAGARVATLSAAGLDNAASSIGLLRDAVDPAPPPSARDYIAAYTHPLPAGTFNRPYACAPQPVSGDAFTCSYEAPDLPEGGARFERTLSLAPDDDALAIAESFSPNDSNAGARLQSVSGFAFEPGDAVVAPPSENFAGVLHGRRFAAISWEPGDVAQVQTRATRGAEIVTLTFARRTVHLRLGIYAAADATEAERLFQAKPPLRLR